MERTTRRLAVLAIVLTLGTLVGAGATFAAHWGGCWKYANYYIRWYNGATGDYYYIYQEEAKTDSNSWDRYTDVFLAQVASAGSTDHINAYAGAYGNTGWLGLASIQRASGCTIYQGNTYLNRTYLDNGYSRTHKKHLACHELGHVLGLGDDTSTNNSCMNPTILTAPHPSSHDREVINAIY